jgi:hypothetical protein
VGIIDHAIGPTVFALGSNGTIDSVAVIPFGTAYLVQDESDAEFSFTFAEDLLRVGAYVTASGSQITLKAYDSGGAFLESQSIASVNVSQWGTNFLGIENATGIRKVTFSGDFVVADGLTFESISAACLDLSADAGMEETIILGQAVGIGGSPTGTGGTPGYTYTWTPTAGLDDSTAANPTASPTSTTIYAVTVTDANGCTAVDDLTVTVLSSEGAIDALIDDLDSDPDFASIPAGIRNALISKLQGASKALAKGRAQAAIGKLNALINQAKAQRGKKLTNTQADEIIAAAEAIINSIVTAAINQVQAPLRPVRHEGVEGESSLDSGSLSPDGDESLEGLGAMCGNGALALLGFAFVCLFAPGRRDRPANS